ncbi:MAG: hypothetical protein K9M99_01545 [Candidatus Cloacimonetes bacterium]|nr:hypothetical protein [Candidatus Cloacimonadota bacterium]
MNSGSRDILHLLFSSSSIITIMMVAFLLVIGIVILMAAKIKKENEKLLEGEVEGQVTHKHIAAFLPLGYAISIPLGIALKNTVIAIALGPAFGLALGVMIGSSKEKKLRGEKRPLTPNEIQFKKTSQLLLTALLALGAILYYISYFVLR